MNDDVRKYRRHNMDRHLALIQLIAKWPLLVWLGACALCVWLYQRNPQPNSESFLRGVVDAEAVSVAPVETARIRRIHVTEGQHITNGTLLVEMDTSLIAYGVTADQLDAIRIETAFGDTHQDVLQAISQRLDSIAGIEAEIAACRQDWEREKAHLEALQAEQARREQLHRERIIDDLTRIELAPEIADLEKAVALYPERIRMYEKQLAESRTYYRNIMEWLGAKDDEPVSDAIRRRLDEGNVQALLAQARERAKLQTQAYELRADRDGTVSEILRREGDVASADVPILRLTTTAPQVIRAHLSEPQVAALHIGQEFDVQGAYRPSAETVRATVESIGPEVNSTTFSLSSTGRLIPVRAQLATLRIRGTHAFLGGEAVILRTPSEGWTGLLDRLLGRPLRASAKGGA